MALSTARLRLLPLGEGHVDDLHRLWTHPGVRLHLWDDRVLAFEQTRDIVMQSGYLMEQHGFGLWGAFDSAGELVGFCGFWFFRNEYELELLYGVEASHWLKGYAREMAAALVAYGFEHLNLAEIRASTDAANQASQRVLKRLGFVPENSFFRPDGKLVFRLPRERRSVGGDGWEAA